MTHQSTPFLGLLLLAGVAPAFSHDLYLMPEKFLVQQGTQLRLVFQNGDEFPEGVSSVRPEKLRNTRLVSRGGTANFENIVAEATRTTATVRVPAAGLAILTAQTTPTFIELDPKKFWLLPGTRESDERIEVAGSSRRD